MCSLGACAPWLQGPASSPPCDTGSPACMGTHAGPRDSMGQGKGRAASRLPCVPPSRFAKRAHALYPVPRLWRGRRGCTVHTPKPEPSLREGKVPGDPTTLQGTPDPQAGQEGSQEETWGGMWALMPLVSGAPLRRNASAWGMLGAQGGREPFRTGPRSASVVCCFVEGRPPGQQCPEQHRSAQGPHSCTRPHPAGSMGDAARPQSQP